MSSFFFALSIALPATAIAFLLYTGVDAALNIMEATALRVFTMFKGKQLETKGKSKNDER